MEGNGPIQGVPKHAGVLVAGHDPAAVDATCCRIMKIDPLRIQYLRLVAERDGRIFNAQYSADRRDRRRRGNAVRIDSPIPEHSPGEELDA